MSTETLSFHGETRKMITLELCKKKKKKKKKDVFLSRYIGIISDDWNEKPSPVSHLHVFLSVH